MDSVRGLLKPLNARRAILLFAFVGLLWLFRHLLVLLVFFVAFERTLGLASRWLARRFHIHRSLALLGVLGVGAVLMAGVLALGVGHAFRAIMSAKDVLPERIAAFRETDLFKQVQDQLEGADSVIEAAKHYSASALAYLAAAGELLVQAVIAFILALVFLFEEDELLEWAGQLDHASLVGTIVRWLGHAADAAAVTLQFQLIVAACNAVLTFPVLLAVGIPNAMGFGFMVFASGMIPVVGNFAAGAILTLLAYQASGVPGATAFVVLTLILHKVESYFLTPRLAARHVHLPGFVMIVSLILWEQLVGFVGLFLSFPFLYVATRIRREFQEEDAVAIKRADRSEPVRI